MIKEKAYAKINITLEVLNKRQDGYHNLKSIMAPIDLYDELLFEESKEIVLLSDCFIKDNYITKAAKLLKEMYEVKQGAKITLIKKIPIGAGLAGGSADCSATLRGLNRLWGLNLSLDKLAEISLMIGSDNAFCMYNKIALVSGRGETISFIDYESLEYVLLVNPNQSISTKQVFENFKDIHKNAPNDLEKSTFEIYPDLEKIKKELEKDNVIFQMSGSGPTMFSLNIDYERLEAVKTKWENKYKTFLIKILKNN